MTFLLWTKETEMQNTRMQNIIGKNPLSKYYIEVKAALNFKL